MAKLVLASASPRRKELLQLIATDFEVAPADIVETLDAAQSLSDNIARLSREKALACHACHTDAFCIGADTLVILNGMALGKPKDTTDAIAMLELLSGKTHEVITGIAVVSPTGDVQSTVAVTRVQFKHLTQAEIADYVQSGEPMDKAGAYGIQGHGGVFVTRIEGDYFSVVGLPVAQLYEMLTRMGALDKVEMEDLYANET